MPKSPEPTTINSVLEEFEKEFLPYADNDTPEHFYLTARSFLASAISKTCDEILGAVPKRIGPEICSCHPRCKSCKEEKGWNAARKAIESKIRELKGL